MFGGEGFLVVIFTLLISYVHISTACNGYSIKLNSAKNCIDNSILKIENGGVTLDKDCNLAFTGCINVVKGFKTAKGTYLLKKPPMPQMDGEFDLCNSAEELDDPVALKHMRAFGVPTKCPVQPTKICGGSNKKVNISKIKNQLALALGTTYIKLEMDHDTGKSCVEISVTFSKGKLKG